MKKDQMPKKIVYPERELGAGSMSILQMRPVQVLHCVSELFRIRVASGTQSLPEDRQISMASRTPSGTSRNQVWNCCYLIVGAEEQMCPDAKREGRISG